jgi:hypothetical protein
MISSAEESAAPVAVVESMIASDMVDFKKKERVQW